jgi:Phage integrase family
VLRAPRGLALWREDWRRQRPRPGVFPARDGSAPWSPTARQTTVNAVVRQRGLPKAASIPTLRHSYATHRLARGVSRRVIPERLGHKRPRTTARDTPLPPPTLESVHATSNALMADLCALWRAVMPEVADILRRDGRDDLDRLGEQRRPRHRRAMADRVHCRTDALGGHL